jgi:hypothetical protein
LDLQHVHRAEVKGDMRLGLALPPILGNIVAANLVQPSEMAWLTGGSSSSSMRWA